MTAKRTLFPILATFLLACALAADAQAYLLQNRDVVFLVRVGTNRDGSPAFRVATSNDYGAQRVFQLATSSAAMEKTASYYRYAQQVRNQTTMEQVGRYGLSESDRRLATSLLDAEPIYVEVKEGGGGIYNDWKGSFTLRDSNSGASYRVQSPRVVLPLGSAEVTGGNSALLEQTLVHEVGHGIMSKTYGTDALCESPYLHQSHSGGSHTDCCLAIIEGYAEFVGAYFTNRLTIANDPSNSLANNLYSYRANGTPKSASELQATEGWVATVLYMLAARSGIQNFMQKMTAIMVGYKPASIQALLDAYMRTYPGDAQAVRATVSKASHGQIYGNAGGGGGAGGGGQGVTYLVDQYRTSLDRYVRLRYAYLAGSTDYYDSERQWVGQAAQQEARRLQQIGGAIRQSVMSGRGAGDTMLQLQQTQSSYQRLYSEVRRRLDTTPWYSRREREKLQAEAQAVGEVLSETHQLVRSLEREPMYYTQGGRAGGRYPAAPQDSKAAYQKLMDTLKSGDRGASAQALEAYEASRAKPAPAAAP